MAKYKCKMCGAPLDVSEGQTVATCEFCQSKQTVANANDERKENLFNRANALRASCDFDKAILSYQSILSLFPSEPEAHWGLCLCKYGIEYVDDPATHKKVPTIHRVSFDSILKDSDYFAALSYSDPIAKEEYQEEANEIANIQKNILSISQKEQPFDIFICYKETTPNGKRTPDSVLAQEIYSNLVEKGYKVFFSRITLESKLGTMYEPYIFAALNSAKIMLCIGTKKEYFEAVWVKNEWSRFIDMMATRPDRYLIPCYKGMEAYEMPEQFLSFQGQDMSKLGFMQDLLRGIDKIMGRSEAPKVQATTKIIQTDVNVSALLKRAEILLGDGNFEKADELLERVLDNDPTNSQAYLFKLLIDLRFKTVEELKTLDETLESDGNFKKAYNFGDDAQKNRLNAINEFINNRNEEARLGRLYDIAMDYKNASRYAEAEAAFSELSGFRDSTQQALECVNLGKEDIYNKALVLKEIKQYVQAIETFEKIKDFKDSEYQISKCKDLSNKEKYTKATELKEKGLFDQASELFMEILSFQDADYQVDECARLKTEAKKEEIYVSCLFDREINPYFDSAALKKACEKLSTIPNYKDADQLLVKYEGILKDYEVELAKKREEDARLKAKKKKKIKKISIISSITSLVLTGVLLLTFLFLIPSGRQSDIQGLINSGKYEEAMSLIEENGSFGDTENLKSICNAGKAFESLDYETGIDYIYKIGGSVDVNYDNNGGTSLKDTETIKRLNSYIDNDADKNGYDFHGWVLTEYTLDAKNHSASIDLKAQYNVITYNISYNLDGGSSSDLPNSYNTEQSISIHNPIKDGYTFLGWTGLDLTTPTIDYVLPIGSTGNKTYTANWKANEYVIHLDANGGTVVENEINVTFDSTYTLPTPTYEGYVFEGWYDSNSNKYDSGKYTTSSDLNLTARWSAKDYPITYNLDGGTNNSSNPATYNIESSEITLSDPTREGYTFLGWTTSSINEPTKNLKISTGSTGDMAFDANWKANTYTITIDLNGGESEKVSYEVTFDESYSIVNPTRTGYSFDKFTYGVDNTEFASSGVYTIVSNITIKSNWIANTNTKYVINHYTEDLDGNGYTKADTSNLTGTSDNTITINANTYEGFTSEEASKNITIAADGSTVVDFYYTRNSYTISFVSNGGSTIADKTYKYEETIPGTVIPTRDGYTFDGWYSDEKQTILFEKMPASDFTVYAYYKEETKASFFNYEILSNEVKITKANALTGKVVVPEYIGDHLVTKIGDYAFMDCEGISEIALSDSIYELGKGTFKGCLSLTKITGTYNLSVIEDETFEGCRSLAFFPDLSSVTSIGNSAFRGCASLTTITITDNLISIGNYAFKDCEMLLQTPDLTNVLYIGDYAFENCKLLTEIQSLNGCTTFGEGILTACENIAKISLSFNENMEQLYVSNFFNGNSSFSNSKFYEVTGKNGSKYYVPNKLTTIVLNTTGKTPDYLLYGLNTITSVTDNSLSTNIIGKHSFDGCTSLSTYTVSNNNIILIDDYAFKNCTSLIDLSMLNPEHIGAYGFANCSSLVLGPVLTNSDYIGDYAFVNCKLLTSIKVSNATYMGTNSLFGCSALTELEIPFVGTTINSNEALGIIFGSNTFENTYSVNQLNDTYYIPNSLVKLTIGGLDIKEKSCVNLTSIKELIISDSVKNIGKGAFQGFNSLESIRLPFVGEKDNAETYKAVFGYIFDYKYSTYEDGREPSVEEFKPSENSADGIYQYGTYYDFSNGFFHGTYGSKYYYQIPATLRNVTITIDTTIPFAAFYNCTMLENIRIPEATDSIGSYAFNNCNALSKLNSETNGEFNIPQGVTTIESYTFNNCSLVENFTMSNNITEIKNYAFANCSLVSKFNSLNLTEMVIPTSCLTIGEYAFKGMALMTNVIVSDSVESIGRGTFNGFNLLESITLPFVGEKDNAETYKAVFGYIFDYDYKYEGDYYPEGFVLGKNNENGICSYGYSTGGTHSYLIYYKIPETLKNVTITTDTTIPLAAFNNCTMLENIKIPETVETIGSYAFNNCSALLKLNSEVDGEFNTPKDVKIIEKHAFNNCTLVETINISNNITDIKDYAFAGCSLVSKFNSLNPTEMVIPTSCLTIGEYAFKGMALMSNAIISDNVQIIGQGAFEGFNSLESITLPFIGAFDHSTHKESVFGYIFGVTEDRYSTSGRDYIDFVNYNYGSCPEGFTWQYTEKRNGDYYSAYYQIPLTLKEVNVTIDTTIPLAAFNGCNMIEKICLVNCIDAIGEYAFQNCLAKVDYLINPTKSGAWDGTMVADKYNGGTGTQSDPYQIFSAKEFIYFLNQIRNGETYENVYFVLTSNINLGNNEFNSTALTDITSFRGTLNGNGHKVFDGKLVMKDNAYNGLFGFVDGIIKNIGFDNITSNTTTTSSEDVYIGLIVGKLNGILENVYVDGKLVTNSSRTVYSGGIVGYNSGNIINSYSNVDLNSSCTNLKVYAGGLVGFNDGNISGSFAYGNVTAHAYAEAFTYASGLVGEVGTKSNITDSFRYDGQVITKFGTVSTSHNEIGTLASIEDIINYCKVNWDGNIWQFDKILLSLQ